MTIVIIVTAIDQSRSLIEEGTVSSGGKGGGKNKGATDVTYSVP